MNRIYKNSNLTNNFNILYNNTLTEEEKKNLKGILALSYDELEIKTKELKESICSEIENLFSIKFKLKELNKMKNVGDLITIIETKLAE